MTTRFWLTAFLLCLGAGWGLTQPLTKIAVTHGLEPFGMIFWQMVIANDDINASIGSVGQRFKILGPAIQRNHQRKSIF